MGYYFEAIDLQTSASSAVGSRLRSRQYESRWPRGRIRTIVRVARRVFGAS